MLGTSRHKSAGKAGDEATLTSVQLVFRNKVEVWRPDIGAMNPLGEYEVKLVVAMCAFGVYPFTKTFVITFVSTWC